MCYYFTTFEALKFSEIYNQNEIKQSLTSAVNNGRIPHAQLFVGKEGNNTLALAIAYAQFLNCLNKTENDSCGNCQSCIYTQKLVNPDLHFSFPYNGPQSNCDEFAQEFRELLLKQSNLSLKDWFDDKGWGDKKPNIYISECRNIYKKLSIKSYGNGYKVLIIWLPEYLGEAGNSLLKLIEEPVEKTIIILVAESTEKILSTIISRTQMVKIKTYSNKEIENYLIENNISEKETAKQISLMAEGNLNKAIKLSSEMESPLFDDFRNWLNACHQNEIKTLLDINNNIAEKGKEFLRLFLNYYNQILRAALLSPFRNIDSLFLEQELQLIKKLENYIHIDNIQQIHKLVNNTLYEIERNGNIKLILMDLSFQTKNIFKIKRKTNLEKVI